MIVIRFPPPGPLMSLNDRQHWAVRARATKAWRTAAYFAAVQHGPKDKPLSRSVITVALPVQARRRRDPHNYAPTLKACIDGMVDADLWPDDTPEYVATAEPVLHLGSEVIVTITPTTEEAA